MGADHRLKASCERGLRESLFMGWRPPGVHQGDGTTAQTRDAMGPQPTDESGIDHQRLQFAPLRIKTTLNLLNRRDQRGRHGNLQREEVPPVLITDAQQIGQARVSEQKYWLPLALKQSIGGHGGSQSKLLNARSGTKAFRRHEGLDRIHRWIALKAGLHRQHLAHDEPSVRPSCHHIGEGAAAIDRELPAGQSAERRA